MASIKEEEAPYPVAAELHAECSTAGAVWHITSWDRTVDQLIADALPSERCGEPSISGLFSQIILTDEIGVRIDAAEYFLKPDGAHQNAGEPSASDGILTSLDWKNSARTRAGVTGGSPVGKVHLRICSAPAIGIVRLQSCSWRFFYSLSGLMGERQRKSGLVEATLVLQKKLIRTRSGVEVVLANPVVQPSEHALDIPSPLAV